MKMAGQLRSNLDHIHEEMEIQARTIIIDDRSHPQPPKHHYSMIPHQFQKSIISFATVIACLSGSDYLQAEPEITEILASNSAILADADGDFSDWIEIHNPDSTPINLSGYALTDNRDNLDKWTFPSVSLLPGAYRIVFASGKDRTDPAQELHTDFKLSSSGEYLGLVNPDGATIVSEFAPQFPEQFEDESYGPGVSSDSITSTLLSSGAPAKWSVPAADIGDTWREIEFDDAAWHSAMTGLGYGYDGLVSESGDLSQAMQGINGTAYARIPFNVNNAAEVIRMSLRVKYEDGFVVWVNGVQVAADNEPELPAWNSNATSSRSDSLAEQWETYSIDFNGIIQTGTNILAVQIMNVSAGGSDILFLPEVDVETVDSNQPLVTGYLLEPTPGTPNAQSSSNGPRIFDTTRTATISNPANSITVTARLQDNLSPVASVSLRYRAMFDDEATMPMVDDGTGTDTTAGDGIFSAAIPGDLASVGQMIRWAIVATDNDGAETRAPRFPDAEGSPEYYGTVIVDPSLTTKLPVLHRFAERASRAETRAGTRASVYYNGEFYDNVFLRIRGGTAVSWPKKSYKVDFNQGNHFLLREDVPRVDEININATYTDKSYVRALLTTELGNAAGTPSPDTYHIRMHQNGDFYSVAYFVEQPDKDFLRRHDLDPAGALYKGPPGANMDSIGPLEKKTNKETRDKNDLRDFIAGIKLRDLAELEQFVFDNVDIPAQINFMAVVALTQNIDASNKNYFVYRDTFGTGEWQMLPWDLDLTFGPNALNTDTIVYNADRNNAAASHVFIGATPHVLSPGKLNRLVEAVVKTDRTKDMLLRRIRTLTDQFLATDYFPNRIAELNDLLADDVAEDKAEWRTRAHFGGRSYTLKEATDRIINEYLIPRLEYLTVDQAASISSGLTFIEGEGSPVTAHVPKSNDLGMTWTAIDFDDFAWIQGEGGVGFDRGGGDYLSLVGIDLLSLDLPAEQRIDTDGDSVNDSTGVFMRYAFDVPDPSLVGGLTFGMKYDDGYIAYLNGVKIAEKNAPASPAWDTPSKASHPDSQAIFFENIDISESKNHLVMGRNVLAIHGFNSNFVNSDMLFVPRLADEGSGNDDAVGIPEAQKTDALVEFGNAQASGTLSDFIELKNSSAQSVDISGWKVSGSVEHTFNPGTVVLPGDRLYLSPNVAAFRARTASPRGGEAHFVQGNYSGELRVGQNLSLINTANATLATTTIESTPNAFDQWIARFFPDGGADAARDADPDLDGSNNALEFSLASDPTEFSAPSIVIKQIEEGEATHFTVTFTRPTGTSIEYALEQSSALTPDTWQSMASQVTATSPIQEGTERVTFQTIDPIDSTTLFLRIRVTVP